MTDSQLLLGITENDERAWRFICKNMKFGFDSIIRQASLSANLSQEDIDDIFQESCVVLMQNVKNGKVAVSRDGAIFSYLVEIGKFKTRNLLRKRRCVTSDNMITFSLNLHNREEESDMAIDEKQQTQDDFLDKVLALLPAECRALLKYFYWDHKPMDEIASMLGMRNADSAKSKKSKCMNKVKDIATQLVESDEFAEDAVRNAVERAALRALLAEEMSYADDGFCLAALDVDDESSEK